MDHRSDCRLAGEVLARLVAIQKNCRWQEVTVTDAVKIDAAEQLAGWAAVHLAVVLEHGCDCVAESVSVA